MMELIGSDDLLTSYQIFDLIGYQDQGRIMKPSFDLFQREVEKEFWTRCRSRQLSERVSLCDQLMLSGARDGAVMF